MSEKNRYEQRRQKRLQNPKVLEGYTSMNEIDDYIATLSDEERQELADAEIILDGILERIPTFANLEEERAFWDTHDISEYWHEAKPVDVQFKETDEKDNGQS